MEQETEKKEEVVSQAAPVVEAEVKTEKIEETKVADKKEGKKWECKLGKLCKQNKTTVAIVILVIVVAASFGFVKYAQYLKKNDIGVTGVKVKVEQFIKDNAPQQGAGITVKSVVKEAGLYKVTIDANKQEIITYITTDGSKFFTQPPTDLNAAKTDAQANNVQTTPDKVVADQKQDMPEVKLFVMSYCPFGTQIEKGILPVLSALGSKIKFNLEFVNYSMHNSKAQNDRKELDENLRQYCIQKNQPTKLNAYLGCFLKKGQGTEAACITSTGVNAAQVASCMTQSDTQFNVTKDFNDESSYQGQFPKFEVNQEDNVKYGVQGSPTLVVNGTTLSPGRDSESLLKAICSGFKTAPKECAQALSTTAPSTGFGDGTAAAGAAPASCATN